MDRNVNNTLSLHIPTLAIRDVGNLTEHFRVPKFQRGYRWERRQVEQLLNDIHKSDPQLPYYLQPIVVSPNNQGDFDLIDGQQRLTTIYLIFLYLDEINKSMQASPFNPLKSIDTTPKFSIYYETRVDSGQFLKDIAHQGLEQAASTPDYLYMWHAYDCIKQWFNEHSVCVGQMADAINTRVKVIWYELNESIYSWEKFADLNIGKIPLTNSELVKALFMRDASNKNISELEKSIIVDQWDGIERELQDSQFWGFLTNRQQSQYDTLIDLLFDIISHKKVNDRDDYFTFRYFEEMLSGKEVNKKNWDNIYLQYQVLRDWYEERKTFHLLGYLVAIDDNETQLADLFEFSKGLSHKAFLEELTKRVSQSINKTIEPDGISITDLRYGKDNEAIERILTLFNVLTTDNMEDNTQRYSFFSHKNVNGGWSLEHIHAQKSDTLNKKEQWLEWIRLHCKSLHRYREIRQLQKADGTEIEKIDELITLMDSFIKDESKQAQIKFDYIARLFSEIVISPDRRADDSYKDEMANMTLLGKADNSMLSNSVFDVKRRLILNAISSSFIPVCTQRVFLKAYTPQDDNQLYFWGDSDRQSYINAIEETLRPYLYNGYVFQSDIHNNVNQ